MNPFAEPAERGERDQWYSRGACYGVMDAEWFPTPNTPLAAIEKARAICRACPVPDQCKAAGDDERWGIWGGNNRAPSIEKAVRDRAAGRRTKNEYDRERRERLRLEALYVEQRAQLDAIAEAAQ